MLSAMRCHVSPLLACRGPTASTDCTLLGLKHVSLFCFHLPAGFSHLPNGLYPSYIPLSHLEPPSAGSPLLAQLGQHSLFESQKGESIPACPSPQPLLWGWLSNWSCWALWHS